MSVETERSEWNGARQQTTAHTSSRLRRSMPRIPVVCVMTERIPAEGFHPSELIRDEIEARGWSLDELAMRMVGGDREQFGVQRLALDFYFECGPTEPNLRMGDDSARMMAAVFDVSTDYFINLERAWLAWVESPNGRAALNIQQRASE